MSNNGRLTRILLGLLVMQIIVGGMFVWYILNAKQVIAPPLNVLRLENPQTVLNKQVKANEHVRVLGTKCNLTNEAISVDGVSYLVQESPVYQRYLRTNNRGVTRLPGCKTNNYANDLRLGVPDDVTLEPGMYHLEGTETVREGDRFQNAPWYTESFEIIE